MIAYQKHNYVQAEAFFHQVLQKSPDYLDAKLGLLRIKIAEKKFQDAAILIDEINKTASNNPEFQELKIDYAKAMRAEDNQKTTSSAYLKIKDLLQKNKLSKAEKLAQNEIKNHPNNVDVLLLLGLINYKKTDYKQAELYFHKVLKLSPSYIDAEIGLIRIKLAKKQYKQAEQMIKSVTKQAPENIEVKAVQASYYSAIKNNEKINIPASIKKEPRWIDLKIDKGELYAAMRIINQQLILHPQDSTLLSQKAQIFLLRHLYSQAAYYAKKALVIDPNNGNAKEILSTINQIYPNKPYGLNEVGISTFNQYVTNPGFHQVWDFSNIYFSRETSVGPLYTFLNFAERQHHTGFQGLVEFLPVISPYLYFDAYAALGSQPSLFSKYALSLEAYGTIPSDKSLKQQVPLNNPIQMADAKLE